MMSLEHQGVGNLIRAADLPRNVRATMVRKHFLGLPEQFLAGYSRASGLDPDAMRNLAQMNVIVPHHGPPPAGFYLFV
jgi:hypothetical protein